MLSGTFMVNLDAGQNTVALVKDLATSGAVDIFVNQPETGTPTYVLPAAATITINDNGGEDVITADFSRGDPIPFGLSIGSAIPGSLQPQLVVTGVVAGTGFEPAYTLSDTGLAVGNFVLDSQVPDNVISFPYGQPSNLSLFSDAADASGGSGTQPGSGSLDVAAGNYTFNQALCSPGSLVDLTVESGATVNFGASQYLSTLTVNSGASVVMLPAGSQALDVGDLTDNGAIDLANNDLIVNTPSDPSAIVSAFAGTAWGTFQSSYGDNSLPATLDGQPVPSTSVIAGLPNSDDSGLADGTTPASAMVNYPFTLALPGLSDGNSGSYYVVNWGDGLSETYPATATVATHSFCAQGSYLVQLQALDGDPANGYTVDYFPAQPVFVSGDQYNATETDLSGTSPSDVFDISENANGQTVVTKNGTVVQIEYTGLISILTLTDPGSVGVDFTNGDPLPSGGFYVSGCASVALTGPHAFDALSIDGSALALGSDRIYFPQGTTVVDDLTGSNDVDVLGGQVNLQLSSVAATAPALDVAPDVTAMITRSATLSSLSVAPGGTVRVAESSGTASLLTVGTLTLDGPDAAGDDGAVLDLSDNDMIAQQTSASAIETLLAAGYDGGLWDGAGGDGPQAACVLSSAAANDPYYIHGIGYAQVGSATGDWPAGEEFDGTTVSAGDTVLKYTYYGDANLDGTVDGSDYSAYDNGYANTLTGWSNGDFTYAGSVQPFDETLADTGNFYATAVAAAPQIFDVPSIKIRYGHGGSFNASSANLPSVASGHSEYVVITDIVSVPTGNHETPKHYQPSNDGINVNSLTAQSGGIDLDSQTFKLNISSNVGKGTFEVMFEIHDVGTDGTDSVIGVGRCFVTVD